MSALSSFQDDPWSRQRGDDGSIEPMLWYSRFDKYYRPQGPERSLLEAYRQWRVQKGADPNKVSCVSSSWYEAAQSWRWQERAEAWRVGA